MSYSKPSRFFQDKKLVKDLKTALREVEEGKARPLDELMKELGLEGEI
jgi:hypothetical protein